ncbi:BREX-1 system adenine-specific DNA-methyltransferase PglX [Evansella tamaricis]|uniref:site-specific DNA-methyltransferase (adenine-specific) n=1 Tax=Evansella tamaricis TaxID=2069301 RepID=A0ABS6JA24_9BACI|nr:BREX-1 system adenine-specific DNA-methyltransferase PglX [Evansella tamaricis]MBU9710539.1 BREX-1 system adenine-specific DNA-methyltransferase PglX [Evansella tamaricis]
MNKAELKKFAVEARRDLIEKVSLKAEQYGIAKDKQDFSIEENYGQLYVNGKSYPLEMKTVFYSLHQRIKVIGYDQLVEEIAYTWFNRIIAIRYMEVNNYLPDRVHVLSSSTGKNEPDILLQYETMNLDIDSQTVNELTQKGDNEQAYRKLFIAQCNALNKLLPFLFERIDDYTELLLPDYLLDQESIIRKIVNYLSQENFSQLHEDGTRTDNVEVLGWLYQYYMSEKKEQVGGLRNTAVKKEDLPVVTQLFTPKWIVQYMVQNSLGKLYDEKFEDNQLAQHWEYYLKHEENNQLYPEFDSLEELKIIDPACGSGHILIYAFEMLYDMYVEAGYPSREIPQLILENNLYGLDIDKRAQQIANFALLMKAAEKQPRFISRLSRKGESPKLNVYEIVDADKSLSEEAIDYFTKNETEKSLINELLSQFENGKQFGALINPIEIPYVEWINRIYELESRKSDLLDESYFNELKDRLLPVLTQALMLYQKYDVVVTNPPYHSKYNTVLKKFINQHYNDYKSDLYSAFIYKTTKMVKKNGYSSLMTPFTWMFITTHEKLRLMLIEKFSISSLIQLEYSAFKEATVPICTFVIQNQTTNSIGEYLSLDNFKGEEIQPLKVKEAVSQGHVEFKYIFDCKEFGKLPKSPISFWLTENEKNVFQNAKLLGEFAEPKAGLQTGKNEIFLRHWHEVDFNKIGFDMKDHTDAENSKRKWFPYNKGGNFRKWYGNQTHVVNWESRGKEIHDFNGIPLDYKGAPVRNKQYYFKSGLTWSFISSSKFGVRYTPHGFIFDVAGSTAFPKGELMYYLMAFLTSKVAYNFLRSLNPTLNFQVNNIKSLPVLFDNKSSIDILSEENINLSKDDWDSYETSWNFLKHPFLSNYFSRILEAYDSWDKNTQYRFQTLKKNEEVLNQVFIEIYGLQSETSSKVEDDDITLSIANRERDTKSFLSYFIGCVLGRYSLEFEGIAYAGGEFNELKYETFKPNQHGLIQLTDEHYFDNDIIVRLREFLSIGFSPETVNENIQWLAESLTMKKNESPEDRLRRYFIDEFFNDHCKNYQKRPIYWLVDSGKQKGLRTFIYMHRYQQDTMATIRFEHLQEIQSKYQNEIDMINTRIANPSLSPADRREFERSKTVFQKKLEELQTFDKHLATYANEQITIDLDDGVKVNYAKFDKVLAKIK